MKSCIIIAFSIKVAVYALQRPLDSSDPRTSYFSSSASSCALVFFGVCVLHRHERRWSEAEVVANSMSCIDSFYLGRDLVVTCRMSQMWN